MKELRSTLILLLKGLGESKIRIMLTMAIIAAYHLEEKLGAWAATFLGKEDTLTIQVFTAKLNELIAEAEGKAK